MRTVLLLFICLVFSSYNNATAQVADLSFLLTRAEASNFEETSRYDEVMAFLDVLDATSDQLFLTHFGYSVEGRKIPLAIFGDIEDFSAEAVIRSGKTRIFVQANIHAGEVCGKEAMLVLLRSLTAGRKVHWADSLVLLIAPIYNVDGNERISLFNRPRQHGPVGGMGQRTNAQGLDLNRDHIKLDSPEARALIRLMNTYDPHIIIDLHTTNGTQHAYHITYAVPMNPNTYQPIVDYLRDDLIPEVTGAVKEEYGWDYYYYGNLPWRNSSGERAWYTFDHRPRFNTHYGGLRNRFAMLSEAYAYAPFEERIRASLYFVEKIAEYAYQNGETIRRICDEADARSIVGQPQAVRSEIARSANPVTILMGSVEEEKNPFSGGTIFRRTEVSQPERMYEYGTYRVVEEETAPTVYFVPSTERTVIDRLETHGIVFSRLTEPQTLDVERFKIDSLQIAPRMFQGHNEQVLFGAYEKAEVLVPSGTVIVPVNQALGRLAFYLLEPRSDDGLANWALIEEPLQEATYYPIYRRFSQ